MDRHAALAALAGLGILLQAGKLVTGRQPARGAPAEASAADWVELETPGKPVVVHASSHANTRPVQSVRGLLFFMKMDLRSASREDLAELPGIDAPLASRIVDFRDSVGRPVTWQDLDRMPGIGEKTLETLRRLGDLR